MQSGSVNAALLLSSYLGSEHEKIGHGIARSDFAGELGKLFAQKTGTSDTGASAKKDSEPTGLTTAADTTPTNGAQSADKSVEADDRDQSSGSSVASAKKSASTTPEERLDTLKNRTRSSQKIYITNPVLVESIIADLQYPAESIKACKNLQTQDGWISLKNLKELLAKRTATDGSTGQGQITTAQAQALLAAVVQKADGSTGRSTFAAVKDGVTSAIQQKTTGFFNTDEFRTMLDQVLARANTAEVRNNAGGITSRTITGGAATTANGTEIALQSTVAPREGQTESLMSNILPSFLTDSSDDSGEKERQAGTQSQSAADSAPTGVSLSPETLAASKGVPGPDALVSAPGVHTKPTTEFKLDPARAAEAISGETFQERRNDFPATDTAAQTRESSELAAASPTGAAPPETKNPAYPAVPGQTIASLAEEFGATIVSTGGDKQAATTSEAGSPGDDRAAAVQGQNLAPLAKETVKGTADKISAPELQAPPDLSETAQDPGKIATPRAESAQDQPFPDYDPNRASVLTQNVRDQVQLHQAQTAAGAKGEELSGTTREASKSGNGSLGSATADKPPAPVPGTAAGKAGVLASAPTIIGATGDEAARGGTSAEGDSQGQVWRESDGSSAGQAVAVEQKSAAQTMQEGTSVQAHAISGIAKEVEKQLKFKDSISDAAALQSASNRMPESRIEVLTAQQATGANIGYADPGRMADIIENFREHYRGMGGRQLVLELEPEQFGKISIKVGAKKDEVSAVVVTENESARHAILKNAPNLRQSLDDQGLQLGKFQVDVGRDRAGAGNANPDGQKQGGKSAGAPAERTAGSNARVGNRPVYIRRNDALSQVSLFA